MIAPNYSDTFFEVTSHDAEVVPEFVEYDDAHDVDSGTYHDDYDRCDARTPVEDWHCNWTEGHTGHHDAWFEGQGHHVAHWFNENADYLIPEELDLELA